MDIYIYYKVDAPNAENLRQKIMMLQSNLSMNWQVQTALKRRAEVNQSTDKFQTWMEVYTRTPEGFLTALQTACDASNVESLIEGERHIEFFMDIMACA